MTKAKEKRLTILGERLRALRGDRSQAEFAKLIGVSSASIGYYENSERLPDAEMLRKICVTCGVTADYLIGLTRAAAPDDFIQKVAGRYGLSDGALKAFERFNSANTSYGNAVIKMFDALIQEPQAFLTIHALYLLVKDYVSQQNTPPK